MRRSGLVAALVLLTACSGSPNHRASTATTHARATTTTTTTGAPRVCRGDDLAAGEAQQDGASGHVLYFVPLRNTSKTTCALGGYPLKVTADAENGDPLTGAHNGAYFPDPPAGDVAPGRDGLVVLDATSNCTDTFPTTAIETFHNFRLVLRSGGSVSLGDLKITTCFLSVSQMGLSEARPAGMRDCRGEDLRAGPVAVGAAMSHQANRVALTNTSATACWLSGFPLHVTAQDRDGKPVALPIGSTYITPPQPGIVEAGKSGEVVIETTSACDELVQPQDQHKIYRHIVVELAEGGTVTLSDDVVIDATCSVIVSALGIAPAVPDSDA